MERSVGLAAGPPSPLMTVINPHTAETTSPARGPLAWLAELLRSVFGGASTASAVFEVRHDLPAGDGLAAGGAYVVAPGGYRIRVPEPADLHRSINDLLPNVRAGLNLIPPLPHVVTELLREVQDPNATAGSVAGIASSDPAIAASLIRAVNSAAFGLTRKITSASEAVNFIGFASVKAMVLRLQLDRAIGGSKADADVQDLWVHSLITSYLADELARKVPGVDRGFAATLGLLHDLGKLVVATQFPAEAERLKAAAAADPTEGQLARETRVLGVDHATLGANLAGRWGLPGDLVRAIRYHHAPADAFEKSDPEALHQAVAVVHVADQLAKYCYVYQDQTEVDVVEPKTLRRLGFQDDLSLLLTPEVRAAATRAIFFGDDDGTGRGPATVRRFLHLARGAEAAGALAAAQAAGATAGHVVADDVLCRSLFEAGGAVVRGAATAVGVTDVAAAADVARAELNVPAAARPPMALVLRGLLANVAKAGTDAAAAGAVEVVHRHDGRHVQLAVRSPSLGFAARFGPAADPDLALAALDAELANVLNLGWFDAVTASSDGATLVFSATA